MRRLTMIALTATAVTVAGAALAVGSSEGSHPRAAVTRAKVCPHARALPGDAPAPATRAALFAVTHTDSTELNDEVEQDRVPPLLIHHDQLARRAPVSVETIVANTTTAGLKSTPGPTRPLPRQDPGHRRRVQDADIHDHEFDPEWNCLIKPHGA